METILSDLRYAVRSLRNSPTFTVVASVTLALGLGVTTAAWSLAHWLLLRPVPGVHDPGQLAIVLSASRGSSPLAAAAGLRVTWVSYAQHRELMERVTALTGLAGYQRGDVNLGAPGAQPRRAAVHYVMPSYFTVLGVRPALGRPLLPEDDASPEAVPVAVISDGLWAGLFNRDAAVVGKSVAVNGRWFTVVGVAPPAFRGTERLGETDLWLPGGVMERARLGGYYEFVARLAPQASFAQAEAQLRAAFDAMGERSYPQVFRGLGVQPSQRPQITQFVRLALAASLLVLLIGCANVANLFVFRGLARRSLTAMQKVLGAGAGALVRRHLAEAIVVALPAALVGLMLAGWLVSLFSEARLGRWMQPFGRIPVAWPAVAVGCLLAIMSATLAAAAPAAAAIRTDAREAVQGTARTHAHGAAYLRRTLTVIQLGVSLSLVVAALLLIGTLQRLNAIDTGFQPRGVLVFQVAPLELGYLEPQTERYFRELFARLQAAPGLGEVAIAWQAPFIGLTRIGRLRPPESPEDSMGVFVRENAVSPEYFPLLELRFVEGANFTSSPLRPDSLPRREIILSESLARRLFGDGPAVGRVFSRSGAESSEVVGVVQDSPWESLEPGSAIPIGDLRWIVYRSFWQRGSPLGAIMVRSNLSNQAAVEIARRTAAEVDQSLPLYGVTTMTELIQRSLADRILFARILGVLAILAVALAAIGLYGLIAYGVAGHAREFGIRMALGAEAGAIVRLVVREAAVLGAIGVALGLMGAAAFTRVIANRLYEVSPLDPGTYVMAASVLLGTAVVAALVPARAASRVDPIVALRAE